MMYGTVCNVICNVYGIMKLHRINMEEHWAPGTKDLIILFGCVGELGLSLIHI